MNETGHTRFLGGGVITISSRGRSLAVEKRITWKETCEIEEGVCRCVCVSLQWQKQAGTTGAVILAPLPMVLRVPGPFHFCEAERQGLFSDFMVGKTEA